jgi:hypothetical protein
MGMFIDFEGNKGKDIVLSSYFCEKTMTTTTGYNDGDNDKLDDNAFDWVPRLGVYYNFIELYIKSRKLILNPILNKIVLVCLNFMSLNFLRAACGGRHPKKDRNVCPEKSHV